MSQESNHRIYKVGKKRVPSVTTILKQFESSEGLIDWAWKQGKEGKDYKQIRNSAASLGTAAHNLVQGYLEAKSKGEKFTYPLPITLATDSGITLAEAKVALTLFGLWMGWYKGLGQDCIICPSDSPLHKIEQPMVDSEHMFGGTVDAVGHLDGQLTLFDWKTSNSIRSSYLIQIAAYGHLYERNFQAQIERYILVNLNKRDLELTVWEPRDDCVQIAAHEFLLMRTLYGGIHSIKDPWKNPE